MFFLTFAKLTFVELEPRFIKDEQKFEVTLLMKGF